MEKVFENKSDDDRVWIYESPDKGKTVYRREFGKTERELVIEDETEWSLYGWHDFVHVVYMLQDRIRASIYGGISHMVEPLLFWQVLHDT